MSTLAQLRGEFASPCPSLTRVREAYFPHIRTDKALLRAITTGRINLVVSKLDSSRYARHVVYLHHLAAYLDEKAAEHTQPSTQPKRDTAHEQACTPLH